MDPNETLKRLRAIFAEKNGSDPEYVLAQFVDATDYFEALDAWLSKGGFLPEAWKR